MDRKTREYKLFVNTKNLRYVYDIEIIHISYITKIKITVPEI